jgi:tetratricopeptide (TPR) repeat protein
MRERLLTANKVLASIAALLFTIVLTPRAANALICAPTDQASKKAAQLLRDGNQFYEVGDLKQAEASWLEVQQCYRSSTDWPKAVFNLGLLRYREKRYSEAIAYFNEVLQSHPNDKEPGRSTMETNRNYSHRSAVAISECYEEMGSYWHALRWACLARNSYRYYSWCGTCSQGARLALDRRIAYLTMRTFRLHYLVGTLLLGIVFLKTRKLKPTGDNQ